MGIRKIFMQGSIGIVICTVGVLLSFQEQLVDFFLLLSSFENSIWVEVILRHFVFS